MIAELIFVGTELLLGSIVNTNAAFLSKELAKLGVNVYHQSVVGDNAERIKNSFRLALSRSDIVILTGGLGPTQDDITKESVAEELSIPLILHNESLENIKKYFKKTGRKMPQNNIKQAMIPENSVVLKNSNGTAPGCFIEKSGKLVFITPGPPKEMTLMFNNEIFPILSELSNTSIVSKNIEIVSLGESYIAQTAENFLNQNDPTVSPYCKPGLVTLRVTSSNSSQEIATQKCDETVKKLCSIFGENVYGIDCKNIETVLVKSLINKNMKISVAESCTAGLVTSKITSVPGSSQCFEFGITTYSDRIKEDILKIDKETIIKNTAVSAEVAVSMAVKTKELSNSDFSISITGEAGPSSQTEKPIGTVFIALFDGKKAYVRRLNLGDNGGRERIRELSAIYALDFARRYLINGDKTEGGFCTNSNPICLDYHTISLNSVNC